MSISQRVKNLIQEYQIWQKESEIREEEGVISVDEVAARVASFYEKIRGIVEWRDEHLLRKTAIERILNRRLAVQRVNEDFAENFLSELVRGGHFPNKRISFEKVDEVQAIIEKYVFLTEYVSRTDVPQRKDIFHWLLSIAAVEIEEALSLPRRERALIELMAEDLQRRVRIAVRKGRPSTSLEENERKLQIYVAVQRALFKLDDATITYHILEKVYLDWKNSSPQTLTSMGEDLSHLREQIKLILSHPYQERFYQLAEKYDAPYLILHDILTEEYDRFEELLASPPVLRDAIQLAYNKRHSKLHGRIRRAALYSTLSVFFSKVLVALLIEIPVERALGTDPHYVALGLNIAIPPLLMLLLVTTARTTSQRNVERVILEVMKIIQPQERQEVLKIFPPRKAHGFVEAMIFSFYGMSFLISFGLIAWILRTIQFPFFSTLIFLMFVSLVLFAGTRIRSHARELMVEPLREGFFYDVLDIFFLPFIRVGRWLSRQLVRYNVLVLVLNFLIEVPFQMFVEFLEQWRRFLKEKKEEIH